MERLRLWLRSVVLRRRLEREMQEEMAAHIERATSRLMERGMSAEGARRAAVREFGNVAFLQEQARDARGAGWVDALIGDGRFALRQFARRPGMTIIMLIVLAVGMTVSTMLFSFVHSYATQPPPGVEREDDLVRIRGSRQVGEGRLFRTFLEPEFRAYLEMDEQFSAVAGTTEATVSLTVGEAVEQSELEANAAFVTGNFFDVLGVRMRIGGGLPQDAASDPAAATVAVIADAAWDALYGRDPSVLGSTVKINGVPVTIVGVGGIL